MSTTEETLRQALTAIADLAPDTAATRNGMAGRIRSYRQRRLLTIVGATAAGAAAVGMPSVLWLTRRPTPGYLPTPATEPAHPGNLRVPMRLRPTWLPEGVYEVTRSAMVSGPHQTRAWASHAAMDLMAAGKLEQALGEAIVGLEVTRPVPRVEPTAATPDPASPPPSPQPFRPLGADPNTTVGGRPALIDQEPNGQSTASWMIDDSGTVATLFITSVPDSLSLVGRIARSMVPDHQTACETSLRFGWTSPGVDPSTAEITVSGGTGAVSQTIWLGETAVRASLTSSYKLLDIDTYFDEDTTIRGRPGKASRRGDAVVQLANGQWLGVFCTVGQSNEERGANAWRIANEMIIGPDPYLGWIGAR